MKRIQWEKWAAVAICVAAGVVSAAVIFRYVLPILFPFLIAFGMSFLIRPLARIFSVRTGLSQKLCAALLLTLFLIGVCFLLGAVIQRLLLELEDLLTLLLSDGGDVSGLMQSSADFFDTVTSKIGFLKRIGAGERFGAMRDAFNEMMANALGVSEPEPEKPDHFGVELPEELETSLNALDVTAEMLVDGVTLKEVKLPHGALVMLIRRGHEFIVPNGSVQLRPGDRLLMISQEVKPREKLKI